MFQYSVLPVLFLTTPGNSHFNIFSAMRLYWGRPEIATFSPIFGRTPRKIQTGMKNELTKDERDRIFESEFLPHIDSLYNFAVFLQNDEEIAKDLLQETYLRAYKFIGYYEKGTNAKAWLIRILKNTFINEYRKKS